MINAVHAVIYTKDAEAARAFFRDVLGLPNVDAGHGWLIFALPPAEMGVHPTEGENHHQLYLMCDDVEATVAELKAKGVEFTQPVKDAGFGLLTALKVPGGGELSLYQPKHASPLRRAS
jgi:predicted enzyme related to lactoylglutathione lyase